LEDNRVSKSLETVTCIEKYQSSLVDSSDESSSEHDTNQFHRRSGGTVVPESDLNADKAVIVPQPSTSNEQVISHQLRRKLPTLARACDRTGISDRCAAVITSAVLQDFGLISHLDSSSVIDRSKNRRERKRKRVQLQQSGIDEVQGLDFDGRKDKTLTNKKKGNKYYRETIIEEHICLIQQPQSRYIGHVSPQSGSAKDVTQSIVKFLTENNIDLSKIIALGCDGTNVNTGKNDGIIRLLKEQFGRPLQWLICQLHGNELPLRHLLQHLDGVTTGPRAFSGTIGKAIASWESLPIVLFAKIDCDIPAFSCTDLSTDQQYMFDICKAVITGECSEDLLRRDPGAMSHAR